MGPGASITCGTRRGRGDCADREVNSIYSDMASTRSPIITADMNAGQTPIRSATGFEKLLTARGVAAWLGVSGRWVLAHAAGLNRPVLPSVKLGKAVRFERRAVEQFIRTCARFDRERPA